MVDRKHPGVEKRFYRMGKTKSDRVMTAWFPRRGDVIRIIGSAVCRKFRSLYFIMKQTKLSNLVRDQKGTNDLRAKMGKTKKIKFTIKFVEDSLDILREISEKSGAPYRKNLNQALRDGLKKTPRVCVKTGSNRERVRKTNDECGRLNKAKA
jgi:hypothetical protein